MERSARAEEEGSMRSKLFMELVQYENLFKDITFLIERMCSSPLYDAQFRRARDDEIDVISV